jgi:radical SAM superfamily enzyme YgiQ (UPF0313 family)
MRVLLIQPPEGKTIGLNSVFLAEPLGLEMLASSLGPEHECTILDMRLEPDLHGALARFHPDLCGISCSFTPDVGRTLEIAAQIKASLPDCRVFVGGHHASQQPTDFLGSPVDGVVLGDGEDVFHRVVEALEGGGAVWGLPGVLDPSRADAETAAGRGSLPDLAGLPLPARHLVAGYRPQYQMGLEWPVYSVETARGCPYRCRFCSVWELYGGTRRERPVAAIVEELGALNGRFIFFTDDLFFLDGDRMERLGLEIRRAGIRKQYTCQSRADGIVQHRDVVRLWKEIGLRRIFVGLESTTEAGLRSVRKGYGSRTNAAALEILDQLGLSVNGQFIVDPSFTMEDFRALGQYVREKRIAFPSFTILTPLPGTSFHRERAEELETTDPEMFDLFHCVLPTRLPLHRFYEEFATLYREGYFERALRLPTYRVLRYLCTPERVRRFIRTTRNLRALCRARTYLEAHERSSQGNRRDPALSSKRGKWGTGGDMGKLDNGVRNR